MAGEDRQGADTAPRRTFRCEYGGRVFVMILNREAGQTQNVRLILDGEVDVVLRLPPRSCTSLIVKGDEVRVSGIGGGCGLGPRPHRRTAKD